MPKKSVKRREHDSSRNCESTSSSDILDYLKKMDNRLKKLENCRRSRTHSPKPKRFRRVISSSSSASSSPERPLSRRSTPVVSSSVSDSENDDNDVSQVNNPGM